MPNVPAGDSAQDQADALLHRGPPELCRQAAQVAHDAVRKVLGIQGPVRGGLLLGRLFTLLLQLQSDNNYQS